MTQVAYSYTSEEVYNEMMKIANANAASQGGYDVVPLYSRDRVQTFVKKHFPPTVAVSNVVFDFKGTPIAVQKYSFRDILKVWMRDILSRDDASFASLNLESRAARAGYIGSVQTTKAYKEFEKRYCFHKADGHRIAHVFPLLHYADGTNFDDKGVCKGTIVRVNSCVFPFKEFDEHWEDLAYIQNITGFSATDKSDAYHRALEKVFCYELQQIAEEGGISYHSGSR